MERRNRNTDMLSGLPDEIICHILSFLSTRGSLRTSVLAKRWRFLWAHVPNFNFYGNRLDKINRVMMLHEAKTVDTFRLYDVNCCEFQLGTLIIYTIRRGVRNIYLHFDFNDEYDSVYTLPGLLLTCKTLVDLTLVSCGVIPSSSGELFLPNLKKLSLNYVLYEDDNSLRHLLSGCPVLEELTVHDCFREGQKNSGDVFVSSPTLKTLNVEMSPGGEDNHDEMLIIDVPSLVYLKVNRSCGLDCVKSSSKIMASLIEVDITINGDLHTSDIMQSRSNEFISFLCQVRHLKISSDFGEMVDNITGNSSMAKFVNLTKLELNLTVDWYILVEFLEGSDNLEVLTFSLDEIFPYKEPERVPPFMLSRLRTVHLTYSNACEVVFDTVRYILRNAQVLERMEISPCSRSSDTEKLDALQRITLFERVSKACQVAFNTRL